MGICKMVVDGSDTRKPHSYPRTRSRRRIISWARFVIEGDPDRPARPALTPDDGAPDGEVALLRFDDNDAEARGIATLIQRLVQVDHIPPGEILSSSAATDTVSSAARSRNS